MRFAPIRPRPLATWSASCSADRIRRSAGLLNQLVAGVGPALLGKLGALFANRSVDTSAPISEAEAERVTPTQVREIAEQAEKANPGVIDQIGNFYAKHPEVVKLLGGAALAIALARIANRSAR